MAYVGIITDTNGTTGPVGSTLYGTCATAADTVAKVVTLENFDKLITGVTIHVKFKYSNTATNPTLNVNGTGAKSIYRYGTTVPTAYSSWSWFAGAVVSLTYDGSAWIMNDMIGNDNTYDRTSIQTRIYAGATGVFPYCICALDNVGRVQAMTTTSGTGTSKAFNSSQKFAFPPVIFYHSPNSTIANGSVIANNVLYEQFPNVDMRYSCNITTESGFTQYKPIYIECAFNADGTWSPSGITQTFTAGRYYILLGGTYNTSIYQLALWAQHPAFYATSSSEIIPYQNEHRTALVYDNSEDSTSYPWHKFASITITTGYIDTSISFIVSLTYGAVPKSLGILTAHVRTTSTKIKEVAEFEWTLAGNNVNPALFTMVYTDTANTSCAVELYCKPNSRYTGLSFTVLQEESRESVSTKWNLVRYAASAHGIATLPTGTGQVVSSLIINEAAGIALYNSTFKNTLQSTTLTAAATQTFPATGGTVLNTGTTSVSTSTVSGATTIKSIKLNGTNYNIYDSGNTDTKVNVTLNTTTKSYILGTSTTPTSTAQAVTSLADTNIWFQSDAVHATKFYGIYGPEVDDTRPTSANVTNTTKSGMTLMLAAEAMTDGKPMCNGYIMNYIWYSGNWGAQFFIPNHKVSGSDKRSLQWRSQNNSEDWSAASCDWITVLDTYNHSTQTPITAKNTLGMYKIKHDEYGHIGESSAFAQADVNTLLNLLDTGASNPGMDDWYISQYANGGSVTPNPNTNFYRRPIGKIWNTFKGYITLTTSGSGNVVTGASIANDGDYGRKITITKGTVTGVNATDTSSKIFLIGATAQSATPTTYSDNEVYVTSGALTTKTTSVGGGKCTMQYNTTTESLDFVFT